MFDGVKVTIDGGLSVVATLEFFQHDLAEMGHRETSFLCTQTRSPTSRTAGSMTRDSVRRTSDLVQVRFWEVGDAINQRVNIGSGEIGSSSGLKLRVSA